MPNDPYERPPKKAYDTAHLEDDYAPGTLRSPAQVVKLRERARKLQKKVRARVKLTISVEPQLYEALVQLGEEYNISVPAVARQALRDGVRKYHDFADPRKNSKPGFRAEQVMERPPLPRMTQVAPVYNPVSELPPRAPVFNLGETKWLDQSALVPSTPPLETLVEVEEGPALPTEEEA